MSASPRSPEISDETRKRIEEGLANWDDPESEARRLFEAARQKLVESETFRRLEEATAASERLTAADFAFRINTRD